jgi:uncharacterized membrane-anchored protein YjiN (DUF445 family)
MGRLLQTTVEDDGHQALTDIALRSMHNWMVTNRTQLVEELKGFAEASGVLVWLFATTRRVDRMFGELVDEVGAAANNQQHPFRRLIDRFLLSTAAELQRDERLSARVNEEALRVLDDPALRRWLVEVVEGLFDTLTTTLNDPTGTARQRLTQAVLDQAQRVLDVDTLRHRLDRLLEGAVFYALDHYADEFTSLVVSTVAGWNGEEAARRIELLAGRDLQFIRINGTVVGALAGLAIYSLSLLID